MDRLWLYLLLTLAAGFAVASQAGINATLRQHLGHPIWAGLVSFAVGTLAIAAVTLLLRPAWPAWAAAAAAAPWWAWTGGLLGAFFVVTALVVAPRLGAATLVAVVVAGQIAASLILDHYGAIGFPQHSVNPMRLLGAALLVSGVVLVRAY